jgi:hypothetical protein
MVKKFHVFNVIQFSVFLQKEKSIDSCPKPVLRSPVPVVLFMLAILILSSFQIHGFKVVFSLGFPRKKNCSAYTHLICASFM